MSEPTENTRATISVSSKGAQLGDIVLKLFHDVAPGHVKNFTKLAQEGFYNGTTFHRVIPGFMIQGGDSLPAVERESGGRSPWPWRRKEPMWPFGM